MSGRAYFQIGFNRCGTVSLYRFFRANGFAAVHHDGGRLAIAMDANLRAGRHVLSGYERCEAFFDMSFLRPHVHVEMYKYWDRLLEQVPEARFILNLRDVEHWVASRLDMGAWTEWHWERPARGFGPPWDAAPPGWPGWRERIEPFRERYRRCHGLADLDEVVAHWKADWHRHAARVRAGVPADRLLVFDIERDPPEALCRFAGLDEAAARHWRRENPALGRLGRAMVRAVPRTVLRRIPAAARHRARRALRRC